MNDPNPQRGAGCNAPPCSDSSFSAEDARILVRAFIISALIWSVIIMIFALWEKLREKTEEKEIKQNRREAHHLPNGRGDVGWRIDHSFIGILNHGDNLKMTDHLSNPEGHPESVDEKPTNRQHGVSLGIGVRVAICDECYRRNCGQRQTAKESLEKWGHIIFSPNSLCGGTPLKTMNTPSNFEALPLTNCSASCPVCDGDGIGSLPNATTQTAEVN